MKKITLEQLLEAGKRAHRDGEDGIMSLKKEIQFFLEMSKRQGKKRDLYELLGVYVKRAQTDVSFYAKMVYACWELINKIE